MRSDVFQVLLTALDDVGRVFDHVDTSRWPPGELEALKRIGLVRQATGGLHAPCPNCDEAHIESVTIRRTPDRPPRYFIRCPESMRVEVTAEMCVGWQVDGDGLAKAVSTAMDLKSVPKAMVAGRLWRLGRTPWKQTTREVVLATRLHDADVSAVVSHIGVGGRAIIFVPHHPPDDRVWPGRTPAVVALSRVATLGADGLVLDVAAIGESVADADAAAETRSAIPTDPEIKKQIIRQQVKAEIKTHLEDDVLVAAYLEFGSLRKAAVGLTGRLCRTVTKDAIEDAVKRAGGIKALKEMSDTGSVARTVASQSRDRVTKSLQRR